jgi:hypothetical protein
MTAKIVPSPFGNEAQRKAWKDRETKSAKEARSTFLREHKLGDHNVIETHWGSGIGEGTILFCTRCKTGEDVTNYSVW